MALWGLRGKSLLALGASCLLALVLAVVIGWQLLQQAQAYFGQAYARNFTELNAQRILTPVTRELALSQRFAESIVTREWLEDEQDASKKARFMQEAEGYRHAFIDRSYFLISSLSHHYYFDDDQSSYSDQPRYTLSATAPDDSWFFNSMANTDQFNINVNYDAKLNTTKVWFNVVVKDNGQRLGLAGTGFELSQFLKDFVQQQESGVVPMIINEQGAIQAHPDASLIALDSVSAKDSEGKTLFALLADDASRQTARAIMTRARQHEGEVQLDWVAMGKHKQLLAMTYSPLLQWYIVTAVDISQARIIDTSWLVPAVVAMVLLLALLLVVFGFAVERLVLSPLRRLQMSAKAIANGSYEVNLPLDSKDEIGDLSRTFGVMADKVRSHTAELESKVQERTAALEQANREMAEINRKIGASIDYASLIQRAILPDRQLVQSLGDRHTVLWRPRDVVGGDFYVFYADGDNCLLGVIDCAGHGVPGALMTMLMRAAVDYAINEVGLADPAGVLTRTDAAIRSMLAGADFTDAIATNADVGLVYIDRAADRVRFAGAKISLYASNGEDVQEIRGARRALGDKRVGEYSNTDLPLAGWTFYMTTDGFLDQAGGDKHYGFGNKRFTAMLQAHASLPLGQQGEAFIQALESYQGDLPQRDDITVLSFRFD
ncbi:histidine kinase [Pokkaliibacter plantistimulans]|uniref:Histidine kinase n=1 Tax=Pokkaliibacter plantistimulans TaxID=1635171 RepID=A0ABX5M1A4_9GAMM|nr:biofilm regulation protein phosphatase SiaA [Pokkaliibacter plantistimulans]PXF31458.1 histidine kinase [Pokkaliibacter plantistimulans]